MSNFLKYKYRLFSSSPSSGSSPAGLEARVTNLENNEYKVTYYEIISGTSGTVTKPGNSTFSSGEFGLSGNAILSKIDIANKPTFETPLTSNGSVVTVSLNTTNGDYITSGVYTDASVALIYTFTIKAVDWSNVNTFYIIEYTDGNEIVTDYVQLNTDATFTSVPGRTGWNDSIGSSQTTLKGGNVILKNGVDLVARIVNKVTPNTTLTKAAYQVVRVSGAQGQRLAVAFAQANNDNNSADTLGIVTETIATNQEGFIITMGQIEDINTTGSLQGETWVDGDVLYLSPTIPGAITNVKPNGLTGHIVVVGYVEYAHAIHGKIYVKIMNGWELDELHNVYINTGTLANNDALVYDSASSLWKNKSFSSLSSGLVPYTGANANVDLGAYKLLSTGNTTTINALNNFLISGSSGEAFKISAADYKTQLYGGGGINYPSLTFNSMTTYGLSCAFSGYRIGIVANSSMVAGFNNSEATFTPLAATTGAVTSFNITPSANTGQTASTNIPSFKITGNTKTWATGAITNQYFSYLSSNTIAFAGASTATNVYTLFVDKSTAGTNATITNNYAAGFNGNVEVKNDLVVGNPKFTIELVDALTVNFYNRYNLTIDSITNVLNSPTITIQDDGASYTLGNTIALGSKITITASTASVVVLNCTRL